MLYCQTQAHSQIFPWQHIDVTCPASQIFSWRDDHVIRIIGVKDICVLLWNQFFVKEIATVILEATAKLGMIKAWHLQGHDKIKKVC